MNNICKIDANAIEETLKSFSEDNTKKMIYRSLEKTGEKLVEKARRNIYQKMGKGATTTNKYKKSIQEGYHISDLSSEEKNEVLITALGFFLTRFYELGTLERFLKRTGAKDRSRGRFKGDKRYWYRKKGKENHYKADSYRGRINPYYAFKEARNENDLVNDMLTFLEEEINKYMK